KVAMTIGTAGIADANVTTAKIVDSAVTTVKIADANVTTAKIADANVTAAKMATNSVLTASIADANVTVAKMLCKDEDNMASDSAAHVATQQSVKKYVDDQDAADHPAYSGGESHTDGSGLIIKMGRAQSTTDAEQTFTFATPFPAGCVSVVITAEYGDLGYLFSLSKQPTAASFKIDRHGEVDNCWFDWIAIGY
ncbi:unnamed protein product, partial [marine sediment metagenome]